MHAHRLLYVCDSLHLAQIEAYLSAVYGILVTVVSNFVFLQTGWLTGDTAH